MKTINGLKIQVAGLGLMVAASGWYAFEGASQEAGLAFLGWAVLTIAGMFID